MIEKLLEFISGLWGNKLKLPPSSLILEEPAPEDAHVEEVFGSKEVEGGSRDWRPWYPKHEVQSYGDCVSFSYLNCYETMAKAAGVTDGDGNELNLSDLYLAVNSGTSQTGNTLNRVANAARKNGIPLERECPYTRSWHKREQIYNTTSKDAKRYAAGTGHAWVRTDRASLKSALERGPIQIGVGLGDTYRGGMPIKPPSRITVYHAMECGFVDEKDQVHCYDHYNRKEVILSSDYKVEFAKQLVPEGLPNGWQTKTGDDHKLWKGLWGKWIIRPEAHGEVYRVWSHGINKVSFTITDQNLFNKVQDCLRSLDVFVGISEKDFERLLNVIKTYKGSIENELGEVVDLNELINPKE